MDFHGKVVISFDPLIMLPAKIDQLYWDKLLKVWVTSFKDGSTYYGKFFQENPTSDDSDDDAYARLRFVP
jgi:hypothetical protein